MKILFFLLLVFLSLFSTVVFFALTFSASSRQRKKARLYKGELDRTQTVSLEGIESIEIQRFTEDVYFVESEQQELVISEYKSLKAFQIDYTEAIIEGNRLMIYGVDSGSRNTKKYYRRSEIGIPASYKGRITVSVTNGNIYSDINLNLAQFKAASESGDIHLEEVVAEDINITTRNGLVTVAKAEGNRCVRSESGYLKISSGSGDSDVESVSGGISLLNTLGLVKVTTVSGGVLITSKKGGASIHSGTGRLDYTLQEITDSVSLTSESGDIMVHLNDRDCYCFKATSENGIINTYFNQQESHNARGRQVIQEVGENPAYVLEIASTSGDITVNRY